LNEEGASCEGVEWKQEALVLSIFVYAIIQNDNIEIEKCQDTCCLDPDCGGFTIGSCYCGLHSVSDIANVDPNFSYPSIDETFYTK